MKRVLITGANGLLGQKLIERYKNLNNISIIATGRGKDRNPTGNHKYATMDLTDSESVIKVIKNYRPNTVINCAAMTQVDDCELNPDECYRQNIHTVGNLLEVHQYVPFHLIHLSTDFIFNGKDGPYREEDPPDPLGIYGTSKLKSEQLINKAGIKSTIIRTVLIYGIVPGLSRSNIILWVKKSLEENKHIKVVDDQWRTPTLAEDLAEGCCLVEKKEALGVYNISGREMLSPYDIAIQTAEFFGLNTSTLKRADRSSFKQPAKRPPKTGLVLDKAEKELGYQPHSFKEGLSILKSQLD